MPKYERIDGHGYLGDGCVVIVGEAPNEDDDRRGEVFCGTVGTMFRGFLRRVIMYAEETDTYWGKGFWFTNAVKRYYGSGGNPQKHVDKWRDDLFDEICDVEPERVLLFGKAAIESVFMKSLNIADYIGGWDRIDYGNGKLVPTQICMSINSVLHNKCRKKYWERETGWAILNPPKPQMLSHGDVEIVEIVDVDEALAALEGMHELKYVGYDLEYNSDPDSKLVYLAGFAVSYNKAIVFHEDVINDSEVICAVEDLFSNPDVSFIAHNWKADAKASVEYLGIDHTVFTDDENHWIDTLSMSRICDCERKARLDITEWLVGLGGHKQELFSKMRGKQMKHYEQAYRDYPGLVAWYNGLDAVATFRLRFHFNAVMKRDNLLPLWENIVGPIGPAFFDMERIGLQLDIDRLETLLARVNNLIDIELLRIREDPVVVRLEESGVIKPPFNPNSADHKRELFFNTEFGLGLKSRKTTKGGKFSVDQYVMKSLIENYAGQTVMDYFKAYNRLVVLKRSYLKKWPKHMDEAFIMHTNYKQTGARTMRISTTDPPIQTIPRTSLPGDPVMSEIRKELRSIIVPHL